MNYFLLFITSLVTTLLLVPPIKKLAHVTGAIDEPCERKVHSGLVPRMGGLAIFFGFILTYFVYLNQSQEYRGILIGMVVVVLIGIIDDSIGLEPKLKLLGQVVAAMAAMVMSGVNINVLGGVLGSNFDLGMLSWPLTLLWIVGITNAINLSDGLDGLAGGISLIAFSSFGFLAYYREDYFVFSLCLVLAGCILGFLKYNTHPAEIFMGDTGSLFLGYSLGTLSIAGNFKSLTTITLITPVLVLLIPIADTLWAIIRRLYEGRSPFSADKKHFHHTLLKTGMNHSQTVSVIYGLSTALSACAVALALSSKLRYLLLPMVLMGVIALFAQVSGAVNFSHLTTRLFNKLDHWFSFESQSFLSKASLRMLLIGTTIYSICFLVSLPLVPTNLLFIASTTVVLLLFLAATGGENGRSYMLFSLFFLAAAIALVISHTIEADRRLLGVNMATLETIAFWFMVTGVFGKIIFKKTPEIVLSTPLEFFVFLVLISIAIVPEEFRSQYNLVHHTLRTFFLFLSFKIIALTSFRKEHSTASVILSSLVFVVFSTLL
ncbi:Undecaprenyl/decaprenyl-phosphate alpha-N-acetylglucosaminyl 1-phosphate transferase [Sulfidibacter corallicola]|uniref:Undecaprenyl/decaprenyl-phosphate alpha-N-acetylglucosaminyl 1-phosphate transferase n=1 Tax=Sulfidibacter corallicola TaxID=2818388 RepID=A0A8A4TX52_SULCO|nr:MraY family glycosyltransferase [Sulfidibacter corallicola]QTD54060.1 undecaprenyl/decaprenyl-phosphate alpha-N-acetylglucosaminyl 1-phosphate transferase [Sulfidibacter corallicola]